MAAPTRRRFVNITECQHGLAEINTVQSITINDTSQRIQASGDNDRRASFQARGMGDTTGTLVLQDQIQAQALKNAAGGTLTFKGEPESGGTAKVVTITNVEFFGMSTTDAHNAVNGVSLQWGAYSPSGADPVTIALVAPPP